jgi:hypothetical protein
MTQDQIDQSFLEIRSRCLSLAADLDRLDRAAINDPRRQTLRQALQILMDVKAPTRAQQVQLLYSDPAPSSL